MVVVVADRPLLTVSKYHARMLLAAADHLYNLMPCLGVRRGIRSQFQVCSYPGEEGRERRKGQVQLYSCDLWDWVQQDPVLKLVRGKDGRVDSFVEDVLGSRLVHSVVCQGLDLGHLGHLVLAAEILCRLEEDLYQVLPDQSLVTEVHCQGPCLSRLVLALSRCVVVVQTFGRSVAAPSQGCLVLDLGQSQDYWGLSVGLLVRSVHSVHSIHMRCRDLKMAGLSR
jgi:hypothetical protein